MIDPQSSAQPRSATIALCTSLVLGLSALNIGIAIAEPQTSANHTSITAHAQLMTSK